MMRLNIFALRVTWEPRIWLAIGWDSGLLLAVAGLALRISRRP